MLTVTAFSVSTYQPGELCFSCFRAARQCFCLHCILATCEQVLSVPSLLNQWITRMHCQRFAQIYEKRENTNCKLCFKKRTLDFWVPHYISVLIMPFVGSKGSSHSSLHAHTHTHTDTHTHTNTCTHTYTQKNPCKTDLLPTLTMGKWQRKTRCSSLYMWQHH